VRRVAAETLTAAAFAPFGAVIEADPARAYPINGGATTRFHALATADAGPGGAAILSIFRGLPRALRLVMVERHPLGTQAFMPLAPRPWLVAVARGGDRPGPEDVRVFLARGDQGVQYGRGVWHHPLLVLGAAQDFLVVDRQGEGPNCEEADLGAGVLVDMPGEEWLK
jgi:ureidoglycolate lyase